MEIIIDIYYINCDVCIVYAKSIELSGIFRTINKYYSYKYMSYQLSITQIPPENTVWR